MRMRKAMMSAVTTMMARQASASVGSMTSVIVLITCSAEGRQQDHSTGPRFVDHFVDRRTTSLVKDGSHNTGSDATDWRGERRELGPLHRHRRGSHNADSAATGLKTAKESWGLFTGTGAGATTLTRQPQA